jgi:putative acyl-CoA dehydrogenase
MTTHEVFNQSSSFDGSNLFANDLALQEALKVFAPSHTTENMRAQGQRWGSAEWRELATLANEHGPVHKAFNRQGSRVDDIEFHPSWHTLMHELVGSGSIGAPWAAPGAGAQVERAASYYLFGQLENGTQCPVTMSYAVVPVIAKHPALAAAWLPKLLSNTYDPRALPIQQKQGALMGMGMTEKQGGSDLRANTTRATLIGASDWGDEYAITGHKWFFSAPQCDAHLVLAQVEGERLSCFFVPRILADGSRNKIEIQRLKSKVGNRSNASSEVEFDQALGYRLGDEGRGVSTILEMGTLTRLDCAIGSTAIMRAGVAQAIHHARGRAAFGLPLVEQPLMQNVLTDLALESEAALWLTLRMARSFDVDADANDQLLRRVFTPIAKYWICKRTPMVLAEAMEVFGGNGYVEDGALGRLFRESPLNSIWEGSGNVMALDMLRAMSREPQVRAALITELRSAGGSNTDFDLAVNAAEQWLNSALHDESKARAQTEHLAVLLQASLMIRYAPTDSAKVFIASRIASGWRGSFGTLAIGEDSTAIFATIIDRALPNT